MTVVEDTVYRGTISVMASHTVLMTGMKMAALLNQTQVIFITVYSHGQIRVDTFIFNYISSINPSSLYCP